MNDPLMSFTWAVMGLVCLVFIQRWIHTHLHGASLLLVGRDDLATIVYAVVLFPGVVLHEVSHWLMATLLGVRTGKLSVLPRRQADGSLQLGYLEYYKGPKIGPTRESLIGAAPLISGTIAVLLIGHHAFGFASFTDAIQIGELPVMVDAIHQLLVSPNILVWLYFTFAISSAMLPSRSDRHAWPAFMAIIVAVTTVAVVVVRAIGGSAGMFTSFARPISTIFSYLATSFLIAILVSLLFMAAIGVLEWLLGRIRGATIVYGRNADKKTAP